MDENIIELAMQDKRVKMSTITSEEINTFSAIPNEKMNGIFIYCHGLGSNKNWASRFYDKLLDNNYGIYAFDFPGHGNDNTIFSQFDLTLCLKYLNNVIDYVKTNYNVPVYLFGCSYGGFVVLNRIMEKDSDIAYTKLMCPAINFCEIMENKTGISYEYFNNNDYMPLYNNIKVYKSFYDECKIGEEKIRGFDFRNVSIIHGTNDKTVDYNNIRKFSEQNNLALITIPSGKHELYGYDEKIVEFLLSEIN